MKFKSVLIAIVFAVFIGVLGSSCGVDNHGDDSNTNTTGAFTATVDGSAFSSKTTTGTLYKDTAGDYQWLRVSGFTDGVSELGIVLESEYIMSEAFSVGSHTIYILQFEDQSGLTTYNPITS